MLTVQRLHFPYDIPVVGCKFAPYVVLKRADGSVVTDEVSDSAPIDGCSIRYKWYRIEKDLKVCSMHPNEKATLQCIACVNNKVSIMRSYHCTSKCFADSWQLHRALHERASNAAKENGITEESNFRPSTGGSGFSTFGAGQSPGFYSVSRSTSVYSGTASGRSEDEIHTEVGCFRIYTPTADDIGQVLKFECVVIDLETRIPLGVPQAIVTSRVIPAPALRRLIPVRRVDPLARCESDSRSSSIGTFVVLSYNILAETRAKSETFSYCPTWALSWSYRRQNLLREIVSYNADIICLQEVQCNHFEEYFLPELEMHGYQAFFKKKTSEAYNGSPLVADGCATFFRKDRFELVKKYEVEFNKAVQSLTDAHIQSPQRKTALGRLIKDSAALLVVLEAKSNIHGIDLSGRRQLVCVANAHINAQEDLKYVKLWQVNTLLKGLEKIASSAEIPMLVCGDFGSLPGSATHSLLVRGKVEPFHPDLKLDPLGILHPSAKLAHHLPLVSAYSSFARIVGVDKDIVKHKRRLDSTTNEPLFTHLTKDFFGTRDYIFYTADSLMVESLLELLDEGSLCKDTALPSPEWSSDHLALLAEFRCISRNRR